MSFAEGLAGGPALARASPRALIGEGAVARARPPPPLPVPRAARAAGTLSPAAAPPRPPLPLASARRARGATRAAPPPRTRGFAETAEAPSTMLVPAMGLALLPRARFFPTTAAVVATAAITVLATAAGAVAGPGADSRSSSATSRSASTTHGSPAAAIARGGRLGCAGPASRVAGVGPGGGGGDR